MMEFTAKDYKKLTYWDIEGFGETYKVQINGGIYAAVVIQSDQSKDDIYFFSECENGYFHYTTHRNNCIKRGEEENSIDRFVLEMKGLVIN